MLIALHTPPCLIVQPADSSLRLCPTPTSILRPNCSARSFSVPLQSIKELPWQIQAVHNIARSLLAHAVSARYAQFSQFDEPILSSSSCIWHFQKAVQSSVFCRMPSPSYLRRRSICSYLLYFFDIVCKLPKKELYLKLSFTFIRACEHGVELPPGSDACEAIVAQALCFSIPFLIYNRLFLGILTLVITIQLHHSVTTESGIRSCDSGAFSDLRRKEPSLQALQFEGLVFCLK